MFDSIFNWLSENIVNLGLLMTAIVAGFVSLKTYILANEPQLELSLEEVLYSSSSGITGELMIRLKNFGKTPAYNVKVQTLTKPTKTDKTIFSFYYNNGEKIVSLMEEAYEKPVTIKYFPTQSERWYHGFDASKLPNDDHELNNFAFKISWETKKLPFSKKIQYQEYLIDYDDFKSSLLRYEHMPLVQSINRITASLDDINRKIPHDDTKMEELYNRVKTK